ncbi:alpha/beta fold hydrolase [Saccharopolyspora hattusasensis]|uniref:alpha/beta fold hydrolase n=1 Tax=Saccharopolyspora hattusasensis TaxID=1128679 RepID=UPI003D99E652
MGLVAESPAADVLALLDRLELPQVVLGGCSMGGSVAMAVLRAAPQRVAGLLLVDTRAVADNDELRAHRLTVADRAEREGSGGRLAECTLPDLLGSMTHERRSEVVASVRVPVRAGTTWSSTST